MNGIEVIDVCKKGKEKQLKASYQRSLNLDTKKRKRYRSKPLRLRFVNPSMNFEKVSISLKEDSFLIFIRGLNCSVSVNSMKYSLYIKKN